MKVGRCDLEDEEAVDVRGAVGGGVPDSEAFGDALAALRRLNKEDIPKIVLRYSATEVICRSKRQEQDGGKMGWGECSR